MKSKNKIKKRKYLYCTVDCKGVSLTASRSAFWVNPFSLQSRDAGSEKSYLIIYHSQFRWGLRKCRFKPRGSLRKESTEPLSQPVAPRSTRLLLFSTDEWWKKEMGRMRKMRRCQFLFFLPLPSAMPSPTTIPLLLITGCTRVRASSHLQTRSIAPRGIQRTRWVQCLWHRGVMMSKQWKEYMPRLPRVVGQNSTKD